MKSIEIKSEIINIYGQIHKLQEKYKRISPEYKLINNILFWMREINAGHLIKQNQDLIKAYLDTYSIREDKNTGLLKSLNKFIGESYRKAIPYLN